MAADTQCTGDYLMRVQKIFRLPDGGIVGMAGSPTRGFAAVKWLLEGEQGDAPKFKGSCVLILRPDGALYYADDEFPAVPILDRMAAIGSGSTAAMLAMTRGASAAEAVKQSAKIDPYTSEPIQMLALERKPRRRRR
jgi:hypothetical protein